MTHTNSSRSYATLNEALAARVRFRNRGCKTGRIYTTWQGLFKFGYTPYTLPTAVDA